MKSNTRSAFFTALAVLSFQSTFLWANEETDNQNTIFGEDASTSPDLDEPFSLEHLPSHRDHIQPYPPQPYPNRPLRWVLIPGSNRYTGQCYPYYNVPQTIDNQACYRYGDTTEWYYAWAQGGCAPQYALWVNTYRCQ
ncbi:MAG: hypothetical protein NTV34_09665 [Proteobacteria bacterium]|nr:hypothetical protein [Pseudomonadota bacterium]